MNNNISKLIDCVADSNNAEAQQYFLNAIKEKVNTVLDIKKVAITTEIFNKASEEQ